MGLKYLAQEKRFGTDTGGGGGSGTVTSVTAGAGLTGGPITSTGTLAVDFGTSAGTAMEGNATPTPAAHEASHKSGGSDPFLSTDLLEAIVKRLQESGGPTALTIGSWPDGWLAKRVGSTIVGVLGVLTVLADVTLGADATALTADTSEALGSNIWQWHLSAENALGSSVTTNLYVNANETPTNYYHAANAGSTVNTALIGTMTANNTQDVWGLMFSDLEGKPRAIYIQNVGAVNAIQMSTRVWGRNGVEDVGPTDAITIKAGTADGLKAGTRLRVWKVG